MDVMEVEENSSRKRCASPDIEVSAPLPKKECHTWQWLGKPEDCPYPKLELPAYRDSYGVLRVCWF